MGLIAILRGAVRSRPANGHNYSPTLNRLDGLFQVKDMTGDTFARNIDPYHHIQAEMPIKPIDRQRLISDYLDAFRLANPESKPPIVAWNSPFYYFKAGQELSWERKKYRHRDLKRMLANLKER